MKWWLWVRLALEILKLLKGKEKKDVSTKETLKEVCNEAIDNLEVKRCKDCIHWKFGQLTFSTQQGHITKNKWHCSVSGRFSSAKRCKDNSKEYYERKSRKFWRPK